MNRILTIAISVLFVFALVGFAVFFTPNTTQAPEPRPVEATG